MSDRSKAEKLALARRKLKEYQRKEKDTTLSGTRSAPRRETTKHFSNDDAAKKTTKESFVFDSGPSPVQQECQTSDDGSYCPSPEIKNSEEYCNSFSRNEVNGSCDASKNSQHPLSQHISFQSTTPIVSPSVADMFSSSQTTNNEAEMFFNSIPTSNSLAENSSNYSSFPYQTSSFISQESIYQKVQSVNGVTTLSSQCQPCPSEVTEAFSNPQSGADIVQTDTHYMGGNPENENVSDSFEFDSTKIASTFHNNETGNCAEVTTAHQKRQTLPSDNSSSIDLPRETVDDISVQQALPQLSSVEEGKKLNPKGEENMSHSNPEKLNVAQKLVCEETAAKSLPLSSTESLLQMSLQINDLISETFNGNSDDKRNSVSELEHRNQELAAMLAVEQQKNEQLHLQLKEHQSRLSQLESDLGKVRAESEAELTREVGPLQEQLQLHAQTVGILVGEKTELQSALNKSQQLAKQKAGEVEELQGRLKASRHKVAELEKELSASNTSNQQLQVMVKELSAEVEKLKVENKLVTKHLEETEEEKSEIQQKLNTKTSEVSSLQQQLQERQSQLSLTQLRIQQLSISGNTELDSQMETLNQQKISLEHQVAQLQQAVRSVTAERDQASQQYQQYVQQLNSQLQSLATKLESATTENETLLSREQSLIHHVSELEKQLQQQQQQQSVKTKATSSEDSDKIHKLQEKLSDLEEEKKHLHDINDSQQQQIEELSADLKDRLTRIEDLESMIESMKEDQPNKERLLAAIESDKVAAARAVAQNQKLKERLEELENGFVTMSNTKLELTEKLQYEQHVNKEKCEQILDLENELKNIRQQLQEKEAALQQLESKLVQPEESVSDEHDDAEVKQNEQYSLLNQELTEAKAVIEQLKLQNSELRVVMEQQKSPPDAASVHTDKVISSLSASIQQLEAERDSLLSQLQQAKQNSSDNSQADVPTMLHEDPVEMKEAMEKLQEKFKKTMEEVAELSEEKQRLEHLVLQLQGETETIGEYIALYQVQRNILRQRAKENDEQLARVSRDREEMKMKLQELSALVRNLVSEKESSPENIDVHIDESKVTPVFHQDEAVVDISIPSESESHHHEVEKSDGPALQENVMNKEATAEKIIALLSEIGSSNLVDPQTTENFHPCPWCSGRLLTV
ncbi:golgin subfamily A member 2-like [Schistocerca americana]|uniref:golgin subfamily A member 2-like n=1 Tax=Schistocerca americana TaxID=7009 RepID=UPI001F4F1139|nr:golgin subfamily A member 2-like [Schistocerca americana]